MKYNKLVRDKIPEIIKSKGGNPKIRIASEKEYWLKLLLKLQEEVDEFKLAQNSEEFADILEVLKAILKFKKFRGIKRLQNKKSKERGSFKKRIILIES